MRLSSRSDDCWSSNIFSAMTGLVQEYMFKEKLRNCEPVDFSRFVVDLSRERDTWSFGHPILMAHESTTAKFSIIQMVCTAPQKGPGYSFSLQPFLIHIPRPPTRCHLQCCPFQTVCPHPLLWDRNMEPQAVPPLPVICVRLMMMSQDEQHATFQCTHPHTVSLCRRHERVLIF